MNEVNYKSDFRFILRLFDPTGREIGWPAYDWEARFWTGIKANALVASCIGGECVNCLEQEGRILIVGDNHHLSPGRLNCEFTALRPDASYPDGSERIVAPATLSIELVREAAIPSNLEVEVILPYVYLDAWMLAVKYAGYTGTLQEYTDYARRFPEVVEQADTLSRMLSDFSDGKKAVIEALAGQGVELPADPSFAAIAETIRQLRLAVESMPGIVDQSWNGRIQTYDLLNELRNHPHPDFPYRCGVRTSASSVVLSQASAYLCSDGFFTTEQGVKHTFEDDMPEHYVIYYFEGADYTVPAYVELLQEVVALNGRPRFITPSSSVVYSMRSYSDEKYELETPQSITSNSIRHLTMPGVTKISNSGTFISSTSLCTIQFPDLEEVKTGWEGFFRNITHNAVFSFPNLRVVNGCLTTVISTGSRWLFPKLESAGRILYNGGPSSLSLPELIKTTGGTYPLVSSVPALTSIDVPKLETACGGIQDCSGITTLSFPSLKEITGGTLVSNCSKFESIDMPVFERMVNGTGINNCAAFTTLNLPALTTFTGGTLVASCSTFTTLELPALTKISGGTLVNNCAAFTTLNLPALTTFTGGTLVASCANLDHVDLPALEFISAASAPNVLINHGQPYNSLNIPRLREIRLAVNTRGLGTFKGESITLPSLESALGSNTNCALFYSAGNLRHIYLPACTVWDLSPAYMGTKGSIVLHFGRIELGTITVRNTYGTLGGVELGTGSRTAIDIFACPDMPTEYLRGIINALADNSGFSPTLALKFGAANLDKLTDEEKAIAVAKNYSLS